MSGFFELAAMTLDALPGYGRVMCLALLLAGFMSAISHLLQRRLSGRGILLTKFHKGVLVCLLAVPILVWIVGLRMPVYVEIPRSFDAYLPGLVCVGMLWIWGVGAGVRTLVLLRALQTGRRCAKDLQQASPQLHQRLAYWQTRLKEEGALELSYGGGEVPWLLRRTLVLPRAAATWPNGVVDALLLAQLSLVHQRVWWWWLLTELVSAVYWPVPGLRSLGDRVRRDMSAQSMHLAASAYRDPAGWRRDARRYHDRVGTFDSLEEPLAFRLAVPLNLAPANGAENLPDPSGPRGRWLRTRALYKAKRYDPFERAFWLLAVPVVLTVLFTALTVEQRSPEFEPQFLEIRWQDRLGPRLREHVDTPAQQGDASGRNDSQMNARTPPAD